MAKHVPNSEMIAMKIVKWKNLEKIHFAQARSQALSPLPPLVVGRKTLVVAGHVTTQRQGGKKNLLGGRGGRVF